MKQQKTLGLLLVLTMLLSILAGCSSAAQTETTESSDGTGITVVDMTGRTVTLEEPATRIIALTAADCEILYAIGAEEALVGRGTFCD